MKANELRVGNWIKTPEQEEKVYDNFFDTDEGVRFINDWNISVIKPIPLTEEWLIKFGNWDITEEGLISYDLNYDEQLEEWLFYVYNIKGDKINCAMIKYVHQLQNLYFALVGEELEIKK